MGLQSRGIAVSAVQEQAEGIPVMEPTPGEAVPRLHPKFLFPGERAFAILVPLLPEGEGVRGRLSNAGCTRRARDLNDKA